MKLVNYLQKITYNFYLTDVHKHTFYDEPTDHVALFCTQEYCVHSKFYVHKKIIKIALLDQELFNF